MKEIIYNHIKNYGPISVSKIKLDLNIKEKNLVEQMVLRGLNTGKLELTPKGMKIRE